MDYNCGCAKVEINSLRFKWRRLKRKIWKHFFGDVPNTQKYTTINERSVKIVVMF